MTFHTYPKTCPFSSISDIKDKHVTIMGLGLNGGGEAAVRFFLQKGAFVTVTDMKSPEQLAATIQKLDSDTSLDHSRLTYRLGEHKIEDFQNADCVIKNPGVKYEGNKFLAAAKAIETDLSIFLRFTNCPIIAVTGSKGKSSTVSAIYYGLKEAGFDAYLGGNITVSPLTFFDKVNENTPVVIEFSSWQLSDLRGRGVLKPKISIITKIVPDHQNWYGNMKDYVADKRLIYADQSDDQYSIFDDGEDEPGTGPVLADYPGLDLAAARNSVSADGAAVATAGTTATWGNLFAAETKAQVLRYGRGSLKNSKYGVWIEETAQTATASRDLITTAASLATTDSADKPTPANVSSLTAPWLGKIFLPGMTAPETILTGLSVPGDHMKTNVLNAALVLYLMGVPSQKASEILGRWPGIDHRLQFFHTWKSPAGGTVRFYNDSCATVPEAAVAAAKAFGRPVHLMTGGTDKGLDLAPLSDFLTAQNNDQATTTACTSARQAAADSQAETRWQSAANSCKLRPLSLYLLSGTATEKLLPPLDEAGIAYHGPYDSLAPLLEQTKTDLATVTGDQIFVFSPGATSFGMFANEFDRGNKFMEEVKRIF